MHTIATVFVIGTKIDHYRLGHGHNKVGRR